RTCVRCYLALSVLVPLRLPYTTLFRSLPGRGRPDARGGRGARPQQVRHPARSRRAEGRRRPTGAAGDRPGRRPAGARDPPRGAVRVPRPPDWDTLVDRLVGRGTEDAEERERRLATARVELAAEDEFDVTIVNDTVDRAAD